MPLLCRKRAATYIRIRVCRQDSTIARQLSSMLLEPKSVHPSFGIHGHTQLEHWAFSGASSGFGALASQAGSLQLKQWSTTPSSSASTRAPLKLMSRSQNSLHAHDTPVAVCLAAVGTLTPSWAYATNGARSSHAAYTPEGLAPSLTR